MGGSQLLHANDFLMTLLNHIPLPQTLGHLGSLKGTFGPSCDRGVHVDVHVGMWHDFPMYSEGCGSGEGLWQAALALNRCWDALGVTVRS